jgi:hypothetical protein
MTAPGKGEVVCNIAFKPKVAKSEIARIEMGQSDMETNSIAQR